MSPLRAALGKVMGALFPWPTRQRRKAAIAAAREGKEQARDRAAHAATVERQIRRMSEANHFASVIAEQIIRGRQQ